MQEQCAQSGSVSLVNPCSTPMQKQHVTLGFAKRVLNISTSAKLHAALQRDSSQQALMVTCNLSTVISKA